MYTLYGVLVHIGGSMHSGHYYCFVRISTGMLYSLDINEVVQVDEEIVLDQKAYMLFYVRDKNDLAFRSPLLSQKGNLVATSLRNVSTSNFADVAIQNGLKEKKQIGIVTNDVLEIMEKDSDRPDEQGLSNQENVSNLCSTQSCPKDDYVLKCNGTVPSEASVVETDEVLVSKPGVDDSVQPTKEMDIISGVSDILPPTNVMFVVRIKLLTENLIWF